MQTCSICKDWIPPIVASYSSKQFSRHLCIECQNTERDRRKKEYIENYKFKDKK